MAKLLTALNISAERQNQLQSDVFVAEDLVIAMQMFYQRQPEGKKKEILETTIIELIGEIVREINK